MNRTPPSAYFHLCPPQDGSELTEAKVHINSSVVTVYLASVDRKPPLVKFPNKNSLGRRESYVFVTKDKSIEIRLEAEVTGTSCRDNDGGSCCGDSYSGGSQYRLNEVLFEYQFITTGEAKNGRV